jgi:hypothetical protein
VHQGPGAVEGHASACADRKRRRRGGQGYALLVSRSPVVCFWGGVEGGSFSSCLSCKAMPCCSVCVGGGGHCSQGLGLIANAGGGVGKAMPYW